ncbi:MAG: hypoxanthine phosphoribosyltransferase [Chloroflexi bacterium]|nr:hypoxanthine phosphoribosyltransferase [Chloroflexota bacterium]
MCFWPGENRKTLRRARPPLLPITALAIVVGVSTPAAPDAAAHREISVLLSRREIAAAVERLAGEIRRDYLPMLEGHAGNGAAPGGVGQDLLLVGVLKGAFVFMADLVRAMNMPVHMDFVRVSSYGSGTVTSRKPRLYQSLSTPVKGRRVLLVEDIVDTGLTTSYLTGYLKRKGAASVKLCALLSKPSRREVDVQIDYLGFTIANLFVIGYGLDYAQQYRHLPDVCVLEERA